MRVKWESLGWCTSESDDVRCHRDPFLSHRSGSQLRARNLSCSRLDFDSRWGLFKDLAAASAKVRASFE